MSQRKVIKMRGKAQAQQRPRQTQKKQKPQRPRRQALAVPRQSRRGGNGNRVSMPRVQQPFLAPTTTRGRSNFMKSKTVPFREELGAINGSAAFATTQYSINPGQAATFPWLALEAKQWEKYRIRNLRYEYTPQVTELSANGIGSIVIGFDSEASDAPPNDLVHALNCDPRSFDLPCKRVVLDVPPKYMNQMTDGYFVRPGNLPGHCDIKTYDCGNVNISTIGQLNGGQIGIMAVSYVVDFYIPILEPTIGAPLNNSSSQLIDSLHALTTSTPYGSTLASANTTALPVYNGLKVVNAAGIITPPPGNYYVSASSTFWNTNGLLSQVELSIVKNGIIQNPGTNGATFEIDNGAALMAAATLSGGIFLPMNGTDTIALGLVATFASGVTTATTVLTILAV